MLLPPGYTSLTFLPSTSRCFIKSDAYLVAAFSLTHKRVFPILFLSESEFLLKIIQPLLDLRLNKLDCFFTLGVLVAMKKSIMFIVLILIFNVEATWAENTEDWFKMGVEALRLENYGKAIECFEKVMTLDPDFSLETVYDSGEKSEKDAAVFIKERSSCPVDLALFDVSAKRLLKKSETLVKKARTFEEQKALTQLGMNSINGFYYRFDDQIAEAICVKKSLGRDRTKKGPAGFELDSSDLKPEKGEFVLEKGLLKYRYTGNNYLQSIGHLQIDVNGIGEIEIRIKVKKARRIMLGCSNDASAKVIDRKIRSITIETVPDDRFHTYRVNAKILKWSINNNNIRKLFLSPWGVDNDEVEIDYIRFVSRRDKYVEIP